MKQQDLEIYFGVVDPWNVNQIANMDQTPLEFCFNTKRARHSRKGENTVWTRSTGSGHDKQQCTVQLIVFADGEPLLIFKGTSQLISPRRKPSNTTRES